MRGSRLRAIGLILIVGGMMLCLDGIGSLLLPQYHDVWFDLERFFRMIGGILLSILGIYVFYNAHKLYKDVSIDRTNELYLCLGCL